MSQHPPLIPLHATSHRKNVFLFPGIMGGLNGYANVIKELGKRCSIHGLQYPMHSRGASQNGVHELGATCAQAVAAAGVDGEIYLLGWSMGGLVAYECGSVLYARRRAVSAIIMVDAAPGMAARSASLVALLKRGDDVCWQDLMWARFLEMKCGRATLCDLLEQHDFFALSEDEKFALVERHEKQWRHPIRQQADLRTSFRFLADNYRSLETYVPAQYPGEFLAIASEEFSEGVATGWSKANGAVARNLVNVRGDHLTAILHFAIAPIVELVGR